MTTAGIKPHSPTSDRTTGFRIRYVNFGRNPESRPRLAIREVEIIREASAKALGGAVERNKTREIGWHDVDLTAAGLNDPVLSTFAEREQVFQWHEDGIVLPANRATLEEEAGRVDPAGIRRQCGESIEALEALSRETFSRWIEHFEIGPRRRHLPYR